MNEKYQNLANGIVIQAVKDYRDALQKLRLNNKDNSAIYSKREIEKFFRSEFYKLLTKVDGEILISKLKAELKNEEVAV